MPGRNNTRSELQKRKSDRENRDKWRLAFKEKDQTGPIAEISRWIAGPLAEQYHLTLEQTFVKQQTTAQDIAIFLTTLWTRSADIGIAPSRRTAFQTYVLLAGISGSRNASMLNVAKEGRFLPRGTLQIACSLLPHHECREFGLNDLILQPFMDRQSSHCVAVSSILPKSPLFEKVNIGDIFLEVQDRTIATLYDFEFVLNSRVGQEVRCKVWRSQQRQQITIVTKVQDLYEFNPKHVFCIGLTTFQSVSILEAFSYNEPFGGVRVSNSAVTPFRHDKLCAINHQPIYNIAVTFNLIRSYQGPIRLSGMPLGCRENPWHFFGNLYARNQNGIVDCELRRVNSGPWQFTRLMTFPQMSRGLQSPSPSPGVAAHPSHHIKAAIVRTEHTHLVTIEDMGIQADEGHGLIVDAKQGLICTSRRGSTSFDRVQVTLANGSTTTARTIFLHPTLDLALLRFDTDNVSAESAELATGSSIKYDDTKGRQELTLLPFEDATQRISITARFTQNANDAPAREQSLFVPYHQPRMQVLERVPAVWECGVLVGDEFLIEALRFSPEKCITAEQAQYVIDAVRTDQKLRFRDFDVQVVTKERACQQGLSLSWHERLAKIFEVYRAPLQTLSKEPHPLRKGDIILEVDGVPPSNLQDFGYHYADTKSSLRLMLLREGAIESVTVSTIAYQKAVVDSSVTLEGMLLHAPTLGWRMNGRPTYLELYVAHISSGSPASQKDITEDVFITSINGQHVADIDQLAELFTRIPRTEGFTVTTMDWRGHEKTTFLERSVFWPTMMWRTVGEGYLQLEIIEPK